MGGWTDEGKDGWTDDRWIAGWMDALVNRWTYGCMDTKIDGWMAEWADAEATDRRID